MDAADQEPDPSETLFRVGQDAAGHWLVQQGGGGLEGRFISLAAPVQPWEMAPTWSKAA